MDILEEPNVRGDRFNMIILIFMYMLDNVVAGGLATGVPIVFQNRKISYDDQAEFSLQAYPPCFKLLWAPVIDCLFFKKLGRRKSWLTPSFYLMGILLLFMSMNWDDWLGAEYGNQKPRIHLITLVFFVANFVNTLIDVALDGWSLNILHKRNIGYVGTCNQIGTILGYWLNYVLFIDLDSKDFCNWFRLVPQDYGFVSLSNFIFFWSITFLVSATLLLIFKKDNSLEIIEESHGECRFDLIESYKNIWKVLQIRPVLMFVLILLTFPIPFAPANVVAPLKIIDAGVANVNFVLLTLPAIPFQIILSVVFGQYLTGPSGIRAFIHMYILDLIACILLAGVIFFSTYVKDGTTLPVWYYWVLFIFYNGRMVIKYMVSVSLSAFFCRISDPRYGGMYMTLLWSMYSVGNSCTNTLSLYCVDWLTKKTCIEDKIQMTTTFRTQFDGFYTETILFAIIGVLWWLWARKVLYSFEKLKISAWMLEQEDRITVEDNMLT